MNFSPLQLRKPALAALGERAENLFRDHHYRECTQVMRQFAEGVLRTILKDDRHTYSEMMRTPLVRQLADSLTFEYFRRIRDLGNEASHFRLGTSGTMLETGERHYRVRTADDAAECLKYGHGIAVWLMSLLDREFRYPDFRPLTPPRARSAAQGAPVVFNPDQQAAIELSQGRHLVLAPPGCGKTTLLRDMVRQISNGNEKLPGMTVGLVDERGELAGCYQGVPQNDVGMRTDVLDGCPKAEGMQLLIRSMSPAVVAVDELGKEEDFRAVESVIHCGCTLLATAHGNSLEDIMEQPFFQKLKNMQVFERYIILGRQKRNGRSVQILDGKGKPC